MTTEATTSQPASSAAVGDRRGAAVLARRAAGPGQGRSVRPGALLAIVLTGQLMAVIDVFIVNVGLPTIHARLHASGASLQLIVAGYTIAYAVFLVTGARLGAILGYARMFLSGAALFTLASLGCGLAGTAGQLIALRFLQGAGAAMMIPQVLSLIQRGFAGEARARAMTIYSAVLASGALLGQIAGGLLISANVAGTAWRPLFLVNVPIGLTLLAAGLRWLPLARDGQGIGGAGRDRLDLAGVVTLGPTVLAFVLPLVLGQEEHWPTWGWACLAASAVGVGVFVAVERWVARRGGHPIVSGRVLRLPGLASSIAALFVVMAVFSGFLFALTLHLQEALGDSALRAALTFAPTGVAFAVVSLSWRRFPARAHHGLSIAGFAVYALALLGLAAALHGGGSGGVVLYLALTLVGAGSAAAFSPLMTRALMRIPVEYAADASGLIVTTIQLAIVTGVATFGTLYLNLAGRIPTHALTGQALAESLRHVSAHAVSVTGVVLAAAIACGAIWAALAGRSAAAGS
jgi:MFS family permease